MDYKKVRKDERRKRKNGIHISANGIMLIIAAAAVITAIVSVTKAVRHNTSEALPQSTEAAAVQMPQVSEQAQIPITAATPSPAAEAVLTQQPQTTQNRRGTAQAIPDDIRTKMNGKSMHANENLSYDDLSYLTIPHYDFNYNVTEGHMVVNKAVAEEVLDIFAELYDIKYPIERMELVDDYGADDYTSIDNNNTSAFNYRVSTDGTGRLSKHALGRAIDINPQINPYVTSGGTGSHSNASEYWSRDYQNWSSEVARAAYIGPQAQIYKIFVDEHGWEWGGSWSSYRDYQHFQKTSN